MVFGVGLFDFIDRYPGVDLGCVEPGVAQDLLDVGHVGAVGDQVCSAGMPQHMGRDLLGQPGFPGAVFDDASGNEDGGGSAFAVHEDFWMPVFFAHERGSGLGQVALQPGECIFAQRNHAIATAFALANEQGSVIGVEVGQLQGA